LTQGVVDTVSTTLDDNFVQTNLPNYGVWPKNPIDEWNGYINSSGNKDNNNPWISTNTTQSPIKGITPTFSDTNNTNTTMTKSS